MSDKQKKFLELVNRMMPRMSELEQEKMLAFGEGMAFMCGVNAFDQQKRQTAQERVGRERAATEGGGVRWVGEALKGRR